MPANVITSARLAAAEAGFQTAFNKIFQGTPSGWQKVASKTTSSSAKEVYGWLRNTFGMKELIGEITIESIQADDYEIVNKEFHDTKQVKATDIADDRLGVYAPMFQMMGMGATRAYDEIVFDRLSNGFTYKGYDGKTFFATDHPVGDKAKSTYSNKDTKKMSAANYKAALSAIKSVNAANGKPWGFGQKLLVVCHPAYEMEWRAILFNERNSAGASNELRNSADLYVTPLVTQHQWFVLETGWPVLPIILQERQAIELNNTTRPDDSYVLLNKAFLFQAYGRYNAGYGLPAMAFGSTGADAAA